jgi:hypothetical protein
VKESFIEKRFNHSSLAIISNANAIIREHQAEGYTLTLRQLYYQFVNRKLIQNKQSEYKRIGNVINEARLAGLIDWTVQSEPFMNLLISCKAKSGLMLTICGRVNKTIVKCGLKRMF